MKKFFLNMVIDMAFDEIIKAIQKAANRSSSKIDNKLVKLLKENKIDIIRDVKAAI